MIFVTKEEDLNTKSGLSILYFYAPWLIFHNQIMNIMKELEEEYIDIKYYGIDIDNLNILKTRFRISSLPTILILKEEGKIIKNIIGIRAISEIKNLLSDICKMNKVQ